MSQQTCQLLEAPPSEQEFPTAASPLKAGKGFSTRSTLFFIDWDDTILPTSWLRACGLLAGTIAEMTESAAPQISDSVRRILADLETLAVDVIETCERLGTVVFVTNSSTLWIPFTVRRFFPEKLAICMERFQFYSARPEEVEAALANPETAKSVYYVPSMGTQWKIERFKKVAAQGNFNDFISIGDGYAERVAVLALRAKG